MKWVVKGPNQSMTLGGYAGTGKTTLMGLFRKELVRLGINKRIAFAAFTGKASQVLRNTLTASNALLPQDSCGTIHSLLYKAEIDKEGKITGWKKSKEVEADLLVIDEASMVTDTIWFDLIGCGKPILAIGDHGQLPPIGSSFNLMQNPELKLEKIHRQAEGNPIIQLAHQARETGQIIPKDYAKTVRKFTPATHDPHDIHELTEHLFSNFHDEMLVLCGRNSTRTRLNQSIRAQLGREDLQPEGGERVVCLKNNYDRLYEPIYNGMVGVVEEIRAVEPHWYEASINFPEDNRRFDGVISRYQFHAPELIEKVDGLNFREIGQRFDFGYTLTVHKAQGSQAKTVVLFEERFQRMADEEWRRWLYTAVTRARENLYIIGQ